MSNIITRKIALYPVGDRQEVDRVYEYIRNGMKSQNLAMNQYMSALYVSNMMDAAKEDRKQLSQLYQRISRSKKGSAYDLNIEFAKGLPSASSAKMKVDQDFANAMKKGLKYGKLSLPSYRDDNPLLVHVDFVRLRSTNPHNDSGIYHCYASHDEFLEHLDKDDLELFIKFANYITFKIILGNPHKSAELRSVFKNIFEETYKVCGSSIGIENRKIILNLSLDIPTKETVLDENVVVGVDLGVAIPAVCALNTNDYIRKSIGSAAEFLRLRTKLQSQRRRMQKSLQSTKGGHGREKKLKAMDKLKKREENFVKTYCHFISRQVVDFAVQNGAKYINMENLAEYGKAQTNQFVLRNWSYYRLQQYIEYKAKMAGITVRKVDPYHTSQICSCCGHWEEGQRIRQDAFVCKNPNCKNYGKEINADFNAARNIACSTNFIKNEVTVDSTAET